MSEQTQTRTQRDAFRDDPLAFAQTIASIPSEPERTRLMAALIAAITPDIRLEFNRLNAMGRE